MVGRLLDLWLAGDSRLPPLTAFGTAFAAEDIALEAREGYDGGPGVLVSELGKFVSPDRSGKRRCDGAGRLGPMEEGCEAGPCPILEELGWSRRNEASVLSRSTRACASRALKLTSPW